MSGRRQRDRREDARLFGQTLVHLRGRRRASSSTARSTGSPATCSPARRARSTSRSAPPARPRCCSTHYAGRLEYHDPWHRGREVSHLFRGLVDAFEANALLAEHGHGGLRLVDNGAMHAGAHAPAGPAEPRAYHLIPAGVSKARAVARAHARARLRARRLHRGRRLARGPRRRAARRRRSGSSPTRSSATRRSARRSRELDGNVRVAEAGYGAGVYEAVVTTLAERR